MNYTYEPCATSSAVGLCTRQQPHPKYKSIFHYELERWYCRTASMGNFGFFRLWNHLPRSFPNLSPCGYVLPGFVCRNLDEPRQHSGDGYFGEWYEYDGYCIGYLRPKDPDMELNISYNIMRNESKRCYSANGGQSNVRLSYRGKRFCSFTPNWPLSPESDFLDHVWKKSLGFYHHHLTRVIHEL